MRVMAMFSRRFIGLALFAAATSCSNGWPKLQVEATNDCERNLGVLEQALGHKLVSPRDPWFAKCVDAEVEALKPCTEYKYGSDSASQCGERRGTPVLKDLVGELGRQEIAAFNALKDSIKTKADDDRRRWCALAERQDGERAACDEVEKNLAIEREAADPKAKKKDAFGLVE